MPLNIDYRKIILLLAIVLVIIFRGPIIAAVLPFILAIVLAYLIEPIIAWLERRIRLPRAAATLITIGALVVVVGYVGLWVATNVYNELIELTMLLPAHQKTAMELVNRVIARGQEIFQTLPRELAPLAQEEMTNLSRKAGELIGTITNRLLGAVAALPIVAIVSTITVIATYFFAKDKDIVHNTLLRAAPLRLRPTVAEARDKILLDLAGFFKAQLILFLINTAVAALGLYFIQTNYWMVLSLTLGVLDVVPVVGPGLVLIPWAIIGLLLGNVKLALQLVSLLAVMFAIRQVLQAKILGDSTGIHPALMVVSLWVGIVMFGVWGFIVGPVLVIVGKAVINAGIWPTSSDEPETD